MIPNEDLLRAKALAASRKIQSPTASDGMRIPIGQRSVDRMVPMAPIVRDLVETPIEEWTLTISGEVEHPTTLDIHDLESLGIEDFVTDIHCVTSWTRLGQSFRGVDFAKILSLVHPLATARHVVFESRNDGYSTNCVLEELREDLCFIATEIDGSPIPLSYGGPVRMVIPHLYYWKSAKYLTHIRFVHEDEPGFWEVRGYHNHADPWKNERYS